MTEEALKMAEEWNQHSDMGLNLQALLKGDSKTMDADLEETESRSVAEEELRPNGAGNWKPVSFRFKS